MAEKHGSFGQGCRATHR